MFLPVGGKTRADFLEGVITLAISTEETKEYSAKSDVGLAQVITMPGGEGWGGPPLRRTPCTGRVVKIVGCFLIQGLRIANFRSTLLLRSYGETHVVSGENSRGPGSHEIPSHSLSDACAIFDSVVSHMRKSHFLH